ncbi:MAG: Ig-like domain-containing protein [Bradymonadaceae bacterium]|nr:Ig-like domain-containing protein [Lujinxingiaceae bacterium]
MLKTERHLALAVLAIALFVGAACTDSGVSTVANNDLNNPPIDNTIDPPANSKLLHQAPCNPNEAMCIVPLTINARWEMSVKLVDGNNNPVANAIVKFQFVTPMEAVGTSLGTANAVTNDQGIASTHVTGGPDPSTGVGTAVILVSTTDPSVEQLRFTVAVSSKDASSYEVRFTHSGTAQFDKVDAILFAPTVTCAQIKAQFEANGTLPTAEYTRRTSVDADGTIYPAVFPNLKNGEKFTVAGKAFASTNDNVEVVYGCTDGNPAIEHGLPVIVTVELTDHVPYLKGIYAVSHSFDLRDTLPENIRRIVDVIGRVATDPGSFIVGCKGGDPGCPPGGAEGLIHILIDFIPAGQFSDAINGILGNDFVRAIVRDAINEFVGDFLNGPNVPSWVKNSVTITADIYKTLSNFRVEGKIFILQSPQPVLAGTEVVGLLPENGGRQLWNTLIFKWSPGCEGQGPSCGDVPITASQVGVQGSAIEGFFDGTVFGSDKFEINQHSLTLNYGLLLMAVVEKVVLPAIFGREVDSVDAMLATFINCRSLALNAGSEGSNLYNVAKRLCDTMLAQASTSLRDYVGSNLVFNGSDRFLIGTPQGEHCTLHQPSNYVGNNWPGYPLPYIQQLGKGDPETLKCKWDVQIKFSEGNITKMGGKFHGEREQF